MWSGLVGGQLIEPCILLQHLTGDICAIFWQNELPALENVPV